LKEASQLKETKMPRFATFWERELMNIDLFMRWFLKLSAFQLAILNAIIIDLQPTEDQPQGHDFALPATELVTDLSAQFCRRQLYCHIVL
jgi:hypothetical protein